jgi:pSer/pThr/pTyr-binding forkhead associated (FHA) protein
MARLLWEYRGQVIKDYPFPRGSVTIGRRKDNTIVFTNREVSSSHARIDKIGLDYILTDLQSTNGTFVNGLKVLSHRLTHGDRISIGKNVLLFIGTEKAVVEAERANIPLNETAIIGATRHRKRPPTAGAKIETHYIEPVPTRNYLRIFVASFLVVGALVVLGVFAVKDKPFPLRGILPKTDQGQRPAGTAAVSSAEGEETSNQGDALLSPASESMKSPALTEEELEAGDSEASSFSIDAIIWSSNPKKSYILINGVEFRVGDQVDGRTIARIERDHVVLQSQEGKSIIRLKLK